MLFIQRNYFAYKFHCSRAADYSVSFINTDSVFYYLLSVNKCQLVIVLCQLVIVYVIRNYTNSNVLCMCVTIEPPTSSHVLHM